MPHLCGAAAWKWPNSRRHLKAAGFKHVETVVAFREQEAPYFETMLAKGEKCRIA
jgi:hypothetical protein